MDSKLQKWILRVISANNGAVGLLVLINKVGLNHWGRGRIPEDSPLLITHQLTLLEKEEKIFKEDRPANAYYILLPAGYRVLNPWFKRAGYFILYDKTNIYTLLALLISLAALIVSLVKSSP